MANVFAILTAIVLALASFVAYKNKAAYETEISNIGNDTDKAAGIAIGIKAGPIEKVAKNAKQDGPNAKASLGYQLGRLDLAQGSLTATIDKRTGVDAEVVKQTEKETAQKKTNKDLTDENAAKTAKIEPNKVKIEEFRAKTAKVGDLNELSSKMRATKVELEEISQSITAAEAKLADLTAQNNQTEAQVDATKTKFEKYTSGQSLPTLNTRIRSIYPTWGFVTLASGNNGGVVANSTLDVVRGGTTIAKLLVSSVESNSASASIIPDSISPDVTLMVGDRVVPSFKATPPPKPAPKPAAKPATETPPVDPGADPTAPATDPAAPAAVAPAVEADPAPTTN